MYQEKSIPNIEVDCESLYGFKIRSELNENKNFKLATFHIHLVLYVPKQIYYLLKNFHKSTTKKR